MSGQRASLAQQIADLDDQTPGDVDPENFEEAFSHSDGNNSESEDTRLENHGRDHYEAVEKSKLRQPESIILGKEYEGSRVSRQQALGNGTDENGPSDYSEDSDDHFSKRADASMNSGGSEDEAGEAFDDPDTLDMSAYGDEDEEIDSDDAFGEEDKDNDKLKFFVFRGSKTARDQSNRGYQNEDNSEGTPAEDATEDQSDSTDDGNSVTEGSQSDHNMSDTEESDGDSESGSSSSPQGIVDRSALKAMMVEEQKSMVSTMSQAARTDIAKGTAVKHQRETFDSLLNTRVQLQKALVASNSMMHTESNSSISLADLEIIEAAESAAIKLFNSLSALRASLPSTKTSNKKRPFSATLETPSEEIRDSISSLDSTTFSQGRNNLTKWAQKTHLVSSMPTQNKFSNASVQPLTSVLDAHLSGSNVDRLVSRAHTPRNCAPLQANAGLEEVPLVYDDTDWYSLLLRDLVDSKMASSSARTNGTARATSTLNGPTPQSISALRRENKQHRRGVDVKASKGRKMRYTVQEKIQNFMAPDNRGTWEDRQADELFSNILGRKIRGGLGEAIEDESDEDAVETNGLRLFGGK